MVNALARKEPVRLSYRDGQIMVSARGSGHLFHQR